MKNRMFVIMFALMYVVSFAVNFMPAIKFPDLTVDSVHLLTSVLFTMFLLGSSFSRNPAIQLFSLIGMIACVIVFGLHSIEYLVASSVVMDLVISLQYPLYFVFVVPLFGLNYVSDIDYGTFAALTSIIYGIVFVCLSVMKPSERNVQVENATK